MFHVATEIGDHLIGEVSSQGCGFARTRSRVAVAKPSLPSNRSGASLPAVVRPFSR
jgi:hypothetical protein